MLRFNQKTGDLSLSPSALAGALVLVCGFGGWMTKMSYDVGGWNEVSSKVERIERILIYNHLDAPNVTGLPTWPEPSSPYHSWPALYSALAAARPALQPAISSK